MSQNIVCKKCSLSIDQKAEKFIFCEGDCFAFFHLGCARLTEKEVTVLSINYIWLCDECLVSFRRARDSKNNRDCVVPDLSHATASRTGAEEKSIKDEINTLKDTVAGILETMARLDGTVGYPLRQSTPVSTSFALQDGINTFRSTVNNDESSPQHSAMDDQFSLLLTNIDASVTERDVHRLITQALSVDTLCPECVDIVKLVPSWKNCRAMEYVSFKVVLDNRWKIKALNPTTWPRGIRFREFIRRQSAAWKPIL